MREIAKEIIRLSRPVLAICLLALLALAALNLHGQTLPKVGCQVDLIAIPQTLPEWTVHAWQLTDQGKMIALMSAYPADHKKSLDKATKDCTAWIKNPAKFLAKFHWRKVEQPKPLPTVSQ